MTGNAGPRNIPGMQPKHAPLIAFGLYAATLCGAASAGDWSTSGEFKLASKGVSADIWVKPSHDWQSMNAFERAEPGFDLTLRRPSMSIKGETQRDQLLSLIASVEAPHRGYDAVHWKAHIAPPARPSRLTLTEIFDWIEATPGQPHAIGRYQFIPSTLDHLVQTEGVSLSSIFSPALQDRLATRLLQDAGLSSFLRGRTSQSEYMDAIARVWAGLPLANGLSAYDGYAGNRAVITREEYASAFAKIYP